MSTRDFFQDWRALYEAAILETNQDRLAEKIDAAKSAICDRVEDLHRTGDSERLALHRGWNVLHTIEEMQFGKSGDAPGIGHAA